MKSGKRYFYAKGCRDKDTNRPDETALFWLRNGYTRPWVTWPSWAVAAYQAGYQGAMP